MQPSLIEGLRKYFQAINPKEITISFSTPQKKILREETPSEVKERIEKAIKNMEKGDAVSFTGEEFMQLSKVLTAVK